MFEKVAKIAYLWLNSYLCEDVLTMPKTNIRRRLAKYDLPGCMFEKYNMVGSVLFVVFFAIVFLNLYVPFSPSTWFLLNISANFLITFIFSVCATIVLAVSRYLMYHFRHIYHVNYVNYTLWIVIELATISIIYALFTRYGFTIMNNMGFHFSRIPMVESTWTLFGRAFLIGIICIAIPSVLAGMYLVIADKNRTIRILEQNNVVTDDATGSPKGETVYTLFDVRGSLKLSVRSTNLYYMESDDNYIKVWYRDTSDKLNSYMIRCQLKTIEDNFRGTSLVRCHRKYIVNSANVKMLRKESDGYYLDIANDLIQPIPVSKTYVDNILSMFSDKVKA